MEIRSASIAASARDLATPGARATLDRRVRSVTEEACGANAVAEGVSWGELAVDVGADLQAASRELDGGDKL
jgi:UrcA family protein